MKIAPFETEEKHLATENRNSDGGLLFVRVLGTSDDTTPLLEGFEDFQVIQLAALNDNTPEMKIAVCKTVPNHPDQIVVLGYVAPTDLLRATKIIQPSHDESLVFKVGKSELHLREDGRVRIFGKDIELNSKGRLSAQGAYIDLN